MDADLVHAPGLEPHAQERVDREEPLHLEMGDRLARRVRVEGDPGRVAPVAADRSLDPTRPRRRPAPHERQVAALEPMPADEVGETGMSLLR